MWRTPFRSVALSSEGRWLLYLLLLLGIVATLGWIPAIAGLILSGFLALRKPRALRNGPWSRAAAVTYLVPGGPEALGRHRLAVAKIYEFRTFDAEWIASKFGLSLSYVKAVLREFHDDDEGTAGVGAGLTVPPLPRFGRI